MPLTIEFTGWLFDLYEDFSRGLCLWWIDQDGRRRQLFQSFPIGFYAAGPQDQLNKLQEMALTQPFPVDFTYTQRRDLFLPDPLPVLSLITSRLQDHLSLFHAAAQTFPILTYYDVDIQLSLRHAARFNTFPLALCRVTCTEEHDLLSLQVLDSPWQLFPTPPPLRILHLQPNCNPQHAAPHHLEIQFNQQRYRVPLNPARALLSSLNAMLQQFDPDLILTRWGDTWLVDWLLTRSQEHHFPLALNRDTLRTIAHRKARSYFSYGQIVYRGQQALLFGRWHIDTCNASLWSDADLPGTLEFARVTHLPVQTAARSSPGTGISSMQVLTALRAEILVPWQKQQVEEPKTALDLLHRDQGGLIYQPIVGLHRDVGGIDFVSMYPSIMVRCNISPETPFPQQLEPSGDPPGLVPQTLAPLLEKRLALKRMLGQMPPWHPDYLIAKTCAATHKWLLVTCFGYLGYKNARFGRIEAHEAVTTWGREALLRAKDTAEDFGFTVLHLYVDGLWIVHPNAHQPQDFLPLLDEIAQRTGLSIALDGVYRWIVFLPSRLDERVPVANRYFGVFQDGSLKVRGIEARRRDTAPFIARTQMELLEHLAQAPSADDLLNQLPGAAALLRRRLHQLRAGQVALPDLLCAQKLSRELKAYRSPSPAAEAAMQLAQIGKNLRPGQRVSFLYLRGQPRVHAWDLPSPPDPARLDLPRYQTLLLRAIAAVLQPFGIPETELLPWINGQPRAVLLPSLENPNGGRIESAAVEFH